MEKIIVLLSTYNGEKFLREQLESIKNQKINAEVLLYVRDDGSTDKTKTILKEYEDKMNITYAPQKEIEHIGAGKSFWELLLTCGDADFYCFADQDDIWDDDKIEHSIQYIRSHQNKTDEAFLYGCGYRMITSKGIIIREDSLDTMSRDLLSIIVTGSEIAGCAMTFNRSARNMILERELRNIPIHDWVMYIYMLFYGNIMRENISLFSRRVHMNNTDCNLGKPMYKRLKDCIKRWINNRGIVMDFVIELMDKEEKRLSNMEKDFLRNLCLSRKSIRAKLYILTHPMTFANSKSAIRSFKLRVLFNLL